MTSFPSPNHPRPQVTVLARHASEGRATRRLVLGTHTGTHADAPLHFVPDGTPIDAVGLEPFVGPAAVVDLTPVEPLQEISADRLAAALDAAPAHPRVLLRFDWARRFVDLDFYAQSPFLSRDAAQLLLDRGVRALGIDTPSPDDPRMGQGSDEDSPIHHMLLGAGVVLLEYLANLERLDPGEAFLVALPLPVTGADGAPMRVVAFQPHA
jgi:kynurenine formamidase